MSEMPGPEVAVAERAPAHPAPTAMPIAASSSSAWITAQVASFFAGSPRKRRRYEETASPTDVEGVIGYQEKTDTPAKTAPSAAAAFPSRRTLPAFASTAGRSTRSDDGGGRLSSAHFQARSRAPRFSATAFGLPPSICSRAA